MSSRRAAGNLLARNWPLTVLRGLAALVFAVATTSAGPESTLILTALLFGAWAIADGTFTVALSLVQRGDDPPLRPLLPGGVLGIGIGIATVVWPDPSPAVLLYQVAVWSVVVGIGEGAVAIELRHGTPGDWLLLLLAGALAVAFGGVLAAFPASRARSVFHMLRVLAAALGVVRLGYAFRLRRTVLQHLHS